VIDYPWVVYQVKPTATPSAPWQLEARNLQTGAVVTPAPSTQDMLTPAVNAGRVVWQDFRDVGFGEIYFANLETGETRRITNQPGGQYWPDLEGHWIVWQDNRDTQNEIYGYDLLRRVETRLTNTPENEVRPVLGGGWVLFEDDSAAVNVANFRILDLATRTSAPLTRSLENKSRGTLSSGLLFYQGEESGLPVIRSASLPALQPVFRNHNAVPVTAGMAGSYGNAFALLAAWHDAAGVTAITRYSALVPTPVSESATWTGGAPAGTNFALNEGDFVWLQFPALGVLDLGPASNRAVNLAAGVNAIGYDSFPSGYTLHQLVTDFGLARVVSVRLLDAESGLWHTVTVQGGAIIGADRPIPPVAVVLVELTEAITNWKP
jgi:beta propeller repeat protein